MKVSVARVRFSRQVSDGNYGSETIAIEREVVFNEDEPEFKATVTLLHACRLDVEAELRQSPNWSVRRGVEYPELESPPDDEKVDDDEPAKELEDIPF